MERAVVSQGPCISATRADSRLRERTRRFGFVAADRSVVRNDGSDSFPDVGLKTRNGRVVAGGGTHPGSRGFVATPGNATQQLSADRRSA